MDKYYTPDVSEFCIGFKFYANEKQNDKSTSLVWVSDDNLYPWEITKENYSEVFEYLHYGDLKETAVVKYLDKEDIESLGFEFTSKALGDWYKVKGEFQIDTWTSYELSLMYYHRDGEHRITIWAMDRGDEVLLFQGKAKNKSELKKVLKMIGYDLRME